MNIVPSAVEALVAELGKLPGIGRRAAERLAFHLLRADAEKSFALADAIRRVKDEIGECPACHFLAEGGECAICSDGSRDAAFLCVVEQPLDAIAFEKAGGYRGFYHVLGGRLSPMKGIAPDDLNIADLIERAAAGGFQEIILATNPSVEGDATAIYIQHRLAERTRARLTRLGRGVPMGGALEYADPTTLRAALESRQSLL